MLWPNLDKSPRGPRSSSVEATEIALQHLRHLVRELKRWERLDEDGRVMLACSIYRGTNDPDDDESPLPLDLDDGQDYRVVDGNPVMASRDEEDAPEEHYLLYLTMLLTAAMARISDQMWMADRRVYLRPLMEAHLALDEYWKDYWKCVYYDCIKYDRDMIYLGAIYDLWERVGDIERAAAALATEALLERHRRLLPPDTPDAQEFRIASAAKIPHCTAGVAHGPNFEWVRWYDGKRYDLSPGPAAVVRKMFELECYKDGIHISGRTMLEAAGSDAKRPRDIFKSGPNMIPAWNNVVKPSPSRKALTRSMSKKDRPNQESPTLALPPKPQGGVVRCLRHPNCGYSWTTQNRSRYTRSSRSSDSLMHGSRRRSATVGCRT